MVDIASIAIKADTSDLKRARTDMDRVGKTGQQTERKVRRATDGMTSGFMSLKKAVGAVGAALGTAAIVQQLGAATRRTLQFEESMQRMVGLVGVAEKEVSGFTSGIRELAKETGVASNALADAMFFVTSAGFRGADAMEVLDQSARASATGLGETAEIADLLTSAINAYGQENLSAANASDILTAAVREGKLEAQTLGPALSTVISTASSLGVTFDDVAGTLAVFSRTGVEARRGATTLEAIFSTLLNTSNEGEKALKDVGLSLSLLRDQVKEDGTIAVLRTLDEAFDGNIEKLRSVIPNVEAFRGVMNALGQDAEAVDTVLQGVTESQGALASAYELTETKQRALNRATEQYKQVLEDVVGVLAEGAIEFANFGEQIAISAASLTGSLTELDRIEQEIKDIDRSLQGGFMSGPIPFLFKSEEELKEERERLVQLRDSLMELGAGAERSMASANVAVNELLGNIDLFGDFASDAEKEIEKADKSTKSFNKSTAELSETFTDDVIPAVEEAIEGYVSLREKYDPIFEANRNLSRELDQLNRDWQNGLYETRDAYEAVRAAIIGDNLEIETSTRDIAPAIQEIGQEVNHLENIWENTTRNIQSAMSDMFYDILDQGKVTFDGILDAFKRMAAEMAAQEIMLRFTGQGGGPISSLFSNVMGGGSGGGGLDFGSLASAGGSMWSGVQGLLGGEGLSGFSGMGGELASGLGFGGGGLDSLMVNAGTRSTTLGAGGGITGGGGGGFGSNLMSSAGSMWPLAVIAGMLQSGKLYDQGVRPDPDETFASTQGNLIGQMGNVGPTLQSGVFESLDSILEPIVGGKGAAMLTGSTFHQELWNSINEGIFGSDYQATRGGIKLGMGTHNDFNPTAWTRESKKGGLFSSSSRRYKHSELDDDLREPLVDTYESTLDRVQAMYETIGIDVEEGVLRAVETADMLIGTAGKSEQTEEEIKKQIHEWFSQLSDDMSKAVVDGMSMEDLTELAGAIAPLRRMMATSPVDRARSDYDAGQSTTLRSTYSDATDQVRRLAEAYDGSVQSSRQLSSALQQQQESAYQLAMAYQQTSASVESLFGNLHEQIRTSLMSQEELYNYQRRQVHTLTDMLSDMTDPERIMQTSERIENLVSSMWQPLGEEQRQKKGPQFLEYLEEVEQVAQERLQVGMDKIESSQTDINESIRQGINNAATVMQQAAQGQQEAANRNIEAANMMGMSAEQIAAAVAQLQRSGGMEANG